LDLTFFTGLVGVVVGAVGKELVGLIFRESARRQNELDAVEAIILSTVTEVRTLAITHWSEAETSASATARAASIVARIQYCATLYPELFKNSIVEKRQMDMVFVRFRKALTGDEFGQQSRVAMPNRASDIEIATYDLMLQAKMGRIRSRRLRWLP
jgi:phosphoribosylanthranilate isomerase